MQYLLLRTDILQKKKPLGAAGICYFAVVSWANWRIISDMQYSKMPGLIFGTFWTLHHDQCSTLAILIMKSTQLGLFKKNKAKMDKVNLRISCI